MQRLLISAAHKSSGKTTLTIGLCAALRARGLQVQPYKKGPDYIDPMWLGRAAQRDCHNLDFQTMPDNEILGYLHHYSADADVSIIEGNKGLYDGVALDGSNSNAALAKLTRTPVILVLDTQGMTRGVAPLIMGYRDFDKDLNIAGVILNQVAGPRHEQKLREVIAEYVNLPVLGAVPRNPDLRITERHLGLVPSNETANPDATIQRIAAFVAAHVDLDKLLAIAATAPDCPATDYGFPAVDAQSELRIGIARDAAFGFYYASDLQAFKRAGAELVPIDTLHDQHLPPIDGLFIGGGFPESWATELAANVSLRLEIRQAITAGLPSYAECGGLMYLCRHLIQDEQQADMVGVIDADVRMHRKPRGRGYVTLASRSPGLWNAPAAQTIYAHEFHYSDIENLTIQPHYAYDIRRGHGIDGQHDGVILHNLLASYAHLRDTERYHWVKYFTEFVRARKAKSVYN